MTSLPLTLDQRPPTVAHLFLDRVRATPDAPAYRFPTAEGGPWGELSWSGTAERVTAIAAGLLSLGINPTERVAIASSTRVEWILADLAVMCAGLATTTVYPTTNSDETAYILADSSSRVLFAEDAAQVGKVLSEHDRLPDLTTVIVFDAPEEPLASEHFRILTLPELEHQGTLHLKDQPESVQKAVDELRQDQLATLIYTSGTTGRPKGVRLDHACWSYQGAAPVITGLLRHDDVHFLWLPLSHVFGKTLICGQIATGHVMAVDGRVDKVVENLQTIRPTVTAAVPRIFEKIYGNLTARATPATGGPDAHAVRAAFGGRLRIAVCGSAALSPDITSFFLDAGVPILEGYGLTETAAGSTVNRADAIRVGTVGVPYPGTEVRIAEDGEILLRGPGVMRGYHNLPEKTAEVLDADGWFRTGDIGELGPDGSLRITDRKKDLFKTSGGKYIAPSEVEGRLKALCPFVSNVVVIGDRRNYCTALITLDATVLLPWAVTQGIPGDYAEVVDAPATRLLVDGYVRTLNEGLQRWQTIKKFTLLPRDLDIEHGELTPSLKVKRTVVTRLHEDAVSAMYEGDGTPAHRA
ncbi:AMP-dependent synthetase/ligase [Streptomyces sp. NPDC047939]|uniref:AMP-dependent synthetase/ligase n=1 Tax=Streptomyces sp. NPDC047939 TaxID=3155381 RepID=UPI00343CBB63